MALVAGTVVDGVVVNITKFGAFVEMDGTTGLVHISEVAENYVKDINEHLKEGDKVRVKVLSVEENGKISLSIKQAMVKSRKPVEMEWKKKPAKKTAAFEDQLSKFLKDSEERFQDLKKHNDGRRGKKPVTK